MRTNRDEPTSEMPRHSTPATLLVGCLLLCAVIQFEGIQKALADTLETNIIISICGNGIIDPGEACDDGRNLGVYGPTFSQRSCSPDCKSYGPYCGDGVLQVRFSEQCDEGATNGTSGLCSATCAPLTAVPPTTPPRIVGSIPPQPSATPGSIPAITKTQVVLRGKAYPNSDVHVLLDGKSTNIVRADSNADFLYNTDAVAPGTATFSFWAADSSGVESLITSVVFDVVQSAVTNVNNIFLPPSLSVSDRQIAPGGLVTFSGESVPAAKVTTNLDSDTTNTFSATSSGAGQWAFQLNTSSIKQGFHSVKAAFALSPSSKSGYGKSVSFFVGTKLPSGNLSPDLNGDGKVNLVDFSIFLLSWNTHDIRSDFNRDGVVNLADFSIMLFSWTG